jgi:cytochrome c peroxidase
MERKKIWLSRFSSRLFTKLPEAHVRGLTRHLSVSRLSVVLYCHLAGFAVCCMSQDQTTFHAPTLLNRFDRDQDGRLDDHEKRALRDSFGGIDVPMLPVKPFDYITYRLPDYLRPSDLEAVDNMPPDNPITNAGATLGRVLFYDTQLSKNNTMSCASCHLQRAAFADPRPRSFGFMGGATKRNAMGLTNVRFSNLQGHRPGFFWDERAPTLEAQVLIPIQDDVEMGMELNELEQRLGQLSYYPALFEAAFGCRDITSDRIAEAVAQFLRSLVSFQSEFDHAASASGDYAADFKTFDQKQNLGKAIFINGADGIAEHGCAHCHVPPTFGMTKAMNNGLALRYEDAGLGDLGRKPNDPFDRSNDGKFKAPSLRNVELTAPYMHDGRFATLEQVVDHYSDGVHPHENLALAFAEEETAGSTLGMRLSPEQKEALVAFLKTLTDRKFVTDAKYSDPFVRLEN